MRVCICLSACGTHAWLGPCHKADACIPQASAHTHARLHACSLSTCQHTACRSHCRSPMWLGLLGPAPARVLQQQHMSCTAPKHLLFLAAHVAQSCCRNSWDNKQLVPAPPPAVNNSAGSPAHQAASTALGGQLLACGPHCKHPTHPTDSPYNFMDALCSITVVLSMSSTVAVSCRQGAFWREKLVRTPTPARANTHKHKPSGACGQSQQTHTCHLTAQLHSRPTVKDECPMTAQLLSWHSCCDSSMPDVLPALSMLQRVYTHVDTPHMHMLYLAGAAPQQRR
jgi:hypothetical protein